MLSAVSFPIRTDRRSDLDGSPFGRYPASVATFTELGRIPMKPRRLTIARWMGLIAVLSVNAALVRAFVVQEMFIGGIAMFMVLQLGLLCFLRSRGRHRHFWLGFEVFGMAAVLVLFSCEFFPDSPMNHMVNSYTFEAASLAYTNLPTPLGDHLDEHPDQLLTVLYFAPELVAALLGGLIAACLPPTSPRPARSMNRQASTSLLG
jgi:hypothetical protein